MGGRLWTLGSGWDHLSFYILNVLINCYIVISNVSNTVPLNLSLQILLTNDWIKTKYVAEYFAQENTKAVVKLKLVSCFILLSRATGRTISGA